MNNLYDNNMKMLNEAIEFSNTQLSHTSIINILKSDNDIKKQYCLIELNKINTEEEAIILADNLINKSGPIRETASYKILDLISNPIYMNFFQSKIIISSFIKGITDINPTVSRNIIEVLKYVSDFNFLIKNIISEINITLSQMPDSEKNHSYLLNKKNFNLYWNLEALFSIFSSNEVKQKVIDSECNIDYTKDLINILSITAKSQDYTIREKTAKLSSLLNIEQIINILKNDPNIYVKKYFL